MIITVKYLLPILLLLASINLFGQMLEKPTKLFFIRHAEVVNDGTQNPPLSELGMLKAERWGHTFSNEKIDLIYATDYIRTQQTAEIIADTKGVLVVESYHPSTLDFDQFRKMVKGKTVVIVGHSNTTPMFVNKIIDSQKYKPLEHDDYSSLFIVSEICPLKFTSFHLNID